MSDRSPLGSLLAGSATALLLVACQSDVTGRTAANNAALAAGYPFQVGNQCDGEVASQLQAAGVSPSSVSNISYLEQRQVVRNQTEVVGFDANVRMADQPGLLVVDLSEQCFTRQIYTRDGLELPGISAY